MGNRKVQVVVLDFENDKVDIITMDMNKDAFCEDEVEEILITEGYSINNIEYIVSRNLTINFKNI